MKLINKTYNSSNINIVRKKEIYEDVMIGRLLASHNIHACEVNYNIKGDK